MLTVLYILKNKETEDWAVVASGLPIIPVEYISRGLEIPRDYYVPKHIAPPEGWECLAVTGGGVAGYFNVAAHGLNAKKEKKIDAFTAAEQQDILEFRQKLCPNDAKILKQKIHSKQSASQIKK